MLANSTIVGHDIDQEYGAFRCETSIDGDTVTIIKDLKVKGATSALKQGTKVKNIRLLYDVTDGHDIDCKIDGFGAMKLKSSVVKKI